MNVLRKHPPALTKVVLRALQKVLKLLRSTEYAVRTFQRAKLWRDAPQLYRGE